VSKRKRPLLDAAVTNNTPPRKRHNWFDALKEKDAETAQDIWDVCRMHLRGEFAGREHGTASGLYRWLHARIGIPVGNSMFVTWLRETKELHDD